MSLESWKKEFYPTPANSRAAKRDPVAHSLRKWIGLRAKNLSAHGVFITPHGGIADVEESLPIDAESCALCVKYKDADDYGENACVGCPLFQVRRTRCDGRSRWEEAAPYTKWLMDGDPELMIRWLIKALEREQEKRSRPRIAKKPARAHTRRANNKKNQENTNASHSRPANNPPPRSRM